MVLERGLLLFESFRRQSSRIRHVDEVLLVCAGRLAGPLLACRRSLRIEAERGKVLFGLRRDADAARALGAARAGGQPVPYAEGLLALYAGRKDQAKALFEEALQRGGADGDWAKAKLAQLAAK